MQDNQLLKDIRVLVTRPAHQANALSQMIIEQGGQAVLFPVIEISPMHLSNTASAMLKHPEKIDFIIFISPNAVQYGVAELFSSAVVERDEVSEHIKLVTIGLASARKLKQLLGREADIYPVEQYNSETLLAHKGLNKTSVNNKQIIIFRGHGGRELLADTLKQRGAKVDYAEVYQRLKPKYDVQDLDAVWQDKRPDIITISSNEGLNNLLEIVHEMPGHKYDKQLRQTPLVVVTEKMRLNARTLGFNKVIVVPKASNEDLVDGVIQCYHSVL